MNSRICPRCNFNISVKIGTTSSGRQRYHCKNCHKAWTTKSRPQVLSKTIWNDLVFDKTPLNHTYVFLCKFLFMRFESIYHIIFQIPSDPCNYIIQLIQQKNSKIQSKLDKIEDECSKTESFFFLVSGLVGLQQFLVKKLFFKIIRTKIYFVVL